MLDFGCLARWRDLLLLFAILAIVIHPLETPVNFVDAAKADENGTVDCAEKPVRVKLSINLVDGDVAAYVPVVSPKVGDVGRPVELELGAHDEHLHQVVGRDGEKVVEGKVVDNQRHVKHAEIAVEQAVENRRGQRTV